MNIFLKALSLRNFRNYVAAEVEFSPATNVLCGANAQGKTNLLEAIALLSTGRSFRTHRLSELIRSGAPSFQIEARIARGRLIHTLTLSSDGRNRRLQIDAHTYSHFRPLLGLLPLILHSPADGELIDGSPAIRRRLLNLHLAQSDPLYVHHLTRYWRALQQRNCLLKAKAFTSIDCWEEEMATSAAYLLQERRALIDAIPLAQRSQVLAQEHHLLQFHPSTSPNYLAQLQRNRAKEALLGLTLAGPHRDDFSFWIGDQSARSFASEGQKRTATYALRLAEWDRLQTRIGFPPLFAIDDFGLPLDSTRQQHLRSALQGCGQTFITSPIPLDADALYTVVDGCIK